MFRVEWHIKYHPGGDSAAGRAAAHHLAFVGGREVHAARAPEQQVVVEAGPAHRGRVHNRRHLREVVQQDPARLPGSAAPLAE